MLSWLSQYKILRVTTIKNSASRILSHWGNAN